MQKNHKILLRENNYYLLTNLELDQVFISVLEKSKILLSNHIEIINSQKSPLDKIEKFLKILTKRGSKAFNMFLEALSESNQPYIKSTLMICLNKHVYTSPESLSFDFPDTAIDNRNRNNTKRLMLLINISNSDDEDLKRVGSMKDLDDIKQFFVDELNYLLFEDHSHEDLTVFEIHEVVKRFVEHISTESESQIVFIIMSHGKNDNNIVGQDGGYIEIQRILKYFSDNRIAHVFKMIIFACCRGGIESLAVPESGASPDVEIDSKTSFSGTEQVAANVVMNRTENYKVSRELGCFGPLNSIVLYSTQQNFVSYRVAEVGTVFIQSMLSVLRKSARIKPIRNLVLDIKPKMRELFPKFNQMPDIKEHYFADFYL